MVHRLSLVAASRASSPVEASRASSPVEASRAFSPVEASRASSPVEASRASSPVVVCGLLIAVASLVVAHSLSCSSACGLFLHQGSNPCLLHW